MFLNSCAFVYLIYNITKSMYHLHTFTYLFFFIKALHRGLHWCRILKFFLLHSFAHLIVLRKQSSSASLIYRKPPQLFFFAHIIIIFYIKKKNRERELFLNVMEPFLCHESNEFSTLLLALPSATSSSLKLKSQSEFIKTKDDDSGSPSICRSHAFF